jgi:hypothetical protein
MKRFILAAFVLAGLAGCASTPAQILSQVPAAAWDKAAKGAVATGGTFILGHNPKYMLAVQALATAIGTTIVLNDATTEAEMDRHAGAILAARGVSTGDIAAALQGLNQAYEFYTDYLKKPTAGSIKPTWADLIAAIQGGLQSAVNAVQAAQAATGGS